MYGSSQVACSGRVMVSMLVYDQQILEITCYQHTHISRDCMTGKERPVTEWVEEHITNDYQQFIEDVGIKDHNCYHVLMEITVKCYRDYWGEYDEDAEMHSFSVQDMPAPPEPASSLETPDAET